MRWSESAKEAFDLYPWPSAEEKHRFLASLEATIGFDEVRLSDLPISVRRNFADKRTPSTCWKGRSWDEINDEFQRQLLSQVLDHFKGNIAVTARALNTTPRVISYNARRLGVIKDSKLNISNNNNKERK